MEETNGRQKDIYELFRQQPVFSGSVSASRIFYEKFDYILSEILNILLCLLLIAGIISFLYIFILAQKSSYWQLFAQKNIFNLTIWLGLLAGCYFWAVIRHRQIRRRAAGAQGQVDVYELLSPQARGAWNSAILSHGGKFISAEGLFLALLQQSSIKSIFQRIGIVAHDAETLVKIYAKLSPYKKNLSAVPFLAFELAENFGAPEITAPLLLCALVSWLPGNHMVTAIFTNTNISLLDLETLAQWQMGLRPGRRDGLLDCCFMAEKLEAAKKCRFRYQAIKLAYSLSSKDGGKTYQPEAAAKLLVKAASLALSQRQKLVGESLVRQALS